jgi:hypothetical protein
MKGLQKIGAIGALLLGVAFVLLILGDAVIQPSLGLNTPADLANPAKVFPLVSTLRLVFAVPILFGVATSLTALALDERLQARAPALMRISTASGLAGAVLFLAAGIFSFVGLPELAGVYAENPASVTPAVFAVADTVATGLLTAAIFASGWWVLLASWAALQGGLPKLLNYLGLLFGAVSILALIIPPLAAVGGFVGLVWAFWTGIALWSESPEVRTTKAATA